METAFERPKAGSYETGGKMSLTHNIQIDYIWPHLGVRSDFPFHVCLSHAVKVLQFYISHLGLYYL